MSNLQTKFYNIDSCYLVNMLKSFLIRHINYFLNIGLNLIFSALYQLHLVKAETARAFIPKEFRLVEAFG